MSQENVDVVKRVMLNGVELVGLFRAPNPPDPSATGIDLTAFTEDFETEFIASRVFGSLEPTPSHGLQGFAERWRDWLEPYESYYIEVEELIDAGDKIVSLARVMAQTARDGVAVEHRPAAVWSLQDHEIVRVQFYLDREEAFEAHGLRE
jgi:ketosteroid isomerase-like protein